MIGPKLKSRSFSRQITEIQVGQKVLNTMTALGRPVFRNASPDATAWERANSISAPIHATTLSSSTFCWAFRSRFPWFCADAGGTDTAPMSAAASARMRSCKGRPAVVALRASDSVLFSGRRSWEPESLSHTGWLRVVHAAPASHFDRSVGALENAEIHNNRLTGQCLSGPEQPNKEDPVPQPALKLQKNCCAARQSFPGDVLDRQSERSASARGCGCHRPESLRFRVNGTSEKHRQGGAEPGVRSTGVSMKRRKKSWRWRPHEAEFMTAACLPILLSQIT